MKRMGWACSSILEFNSHPKFDLILFSTPLCQLDLSIHPALQEIVEGPVGIVLSQQHLPLELFALGKVGFIPSQGHQMSSFSSWGVTRVRLSSCPEGAPHCGWHSQALPAWGSHSSVLKIVKLSLVNPNSPTAAQSQPLGHCSDWSSLVCAGATAQGQQTPSTGTDEPFLVKFSGFGAEPRAGAQVGPRADFGPKSQKKQSRNAAVPFTLLSLLLLELLWG